MPMPLTLLLARLPSVSSCRERPSTTTTPAQADLLPAVISGRQRRKGCSQQHNTSSPVWLYSTFVRLSTDADGVVQSAKSHDKPRRLSAWPECKCMRTAILEKKRSNNKLGEEFLRYGTRQWRGRESDCAARPHCLPACPPPFLPARYRFSVGEFGQSTCAGIVEIVAKWRRVGCVICKVIATVALFSSGDSKKID